MAATKMDNRQRRSSSQDRNAEADGQRTLIVGLGETGLSAARYLTGLGESVRVIDSRADPPALDTLRAALPDVPVELETLDPKWLAGAARVVWSPGLNIAVPLAAEARRRGIEIVSDIELFARAARAPVVAVTGSNGKSTVTMLTARMLEAAGLSAPAGGNLGPPALDLLDAESATPDVYVLEISSFQMETTESLQPLAAAVLNVSADHLDRHGDLEHYAALKAKLLGAADHAVFNRDDPLVRRAGERSARPVPFSTETRLERGCSIVEAGGRRWLAVDGTPRVPADALALRGAHNEANALAALALTVTVLEQLGRADSGALDAAADALQRFAGLEHRCRPIAERGGVTWIDDSKATNVGATVAALSGLPGRLILIAGGVSKGADFSPLAAAARGKVAAAVLIGSAASQIEDELREVCTVWRATDMAAAVRAAAAHARPGDTVLLSPACASQDMFRDYRHRGEAFADAVRRLPS